MNARPLLPESLRSPLWLMVVHVLPQILLGLVLWRAWVLVAGELDPGGRGAYLSLLGMQVGVILAALGGGVALHRRRAQVRWPLALAYLTLNIGFLWASMALSDNLVPSTVADWMLSPLHLIFAQLCLVAPALFYCAICVAGQTLRLSLPADIGGSAAALVLVPAGWYIFVILGHTFFSRIDMPFAAGMTFFILSTALVMFAFLRLLLWLYRTAHGTIIPPLLAGLILPFGGLALNAAIPFPVDLQYGAVYALTAINGILLLLPRRGGPTAHLILWLARVALFPFTLYFFMLFLPFLPFSILAMIAAGAGFLILAPTLLFVIHARILCDEARLLAVSRSRGGLLALAMLAFALMPLGYAGRALIHRNALLRAVDTLYAPDLAVDQPRINPTITRAALKRLQAMKEGLYLPFLSEIYNRLVFNGMVLPDHKVKQISELICGEDLSRDPLERRGRFNLFADMFAFGGRSRTALWNNVRQPPRNVVLEDLRVATITTNGPLVTLRVELDLQNDHLDMAEYVTAIELPPWMTVSGFALKMQDTWVPGRIFDRKSAMWVYHMIRDTTRRDPGLLVYKAPHLLQLSIYPFASGERRQCALTFTLLAGEAADLAIGERRLVLAEATATAPPILQVPLAGDAVALYVPRARAARLPAQARPVNVHFLLDASASAVEALPAYADRVNAFLTRHPWVTSTAATAVNYGSVPLCPAGTAPSELLRTLARRGAELRAQGGYWPDAAIRRILSKELSARSPGLQATLFVEVAQTNAVPVEDLAAWLELLPDTRVVRDDATLAADGIPVLQLLSDDGWALLAPDTGGWLFQTGGMDRGDVQVSTASGTMALTPELRLSGESLFASLAQLRKLGAEQLLNPPQAEALRGTILNTSRQHGLLAPATAYMAVENSAQWVMLERAEKQSMNAHAALEFDEFKTPEPEVWLVLGAFLLWMTARGWRRHRSTRTLR